MARRAHPGTSTRRTLDGDAEFDTLKAAVLKQGKESTA